MSNSWFFPASLPALVAAVSLCALPSTLGAVPAGSPFGNVAPRITGGAPIWTEEGRDYYFKPYAYDANGDPLTFAISGKPHWAQFAPSTGALSGKPPKGAAGKYKNVVISVSDGKAQAYLQPFAIDVNPVTRVVTLRWSTPTRNTDGSPLRDLAGFKVFYGQASGTYPKSLRVAGAAIDSIQIEGLTAGRWYFAVTSFNAGGVHSNYSSEVSAVL